VSGRVDPPTLYGERVTLRPLTAQDVPVLNAMVALRGVREWWGTDPTVEEENAFTINVDDQVAGWLAFYEEDDPDYRHGGLDIFVAPAFQGRGLGPEALSLAARWLLEERGHHRLIIDPAAANERAIKTYAAIGFKPVGIMRRYERGPDGAWHDGLLMDMLAEEFTPR
jgi:aminoglycoside 6'-N-acetyltransferase